MYGHKKWCLWSLDYCSRYKNNPVSSNSVKADVQFPGGQEDIVAKMEEKPRGLHSCSFRDVRDLSDSQALLKSESSIDMVTILTS